ncbi:MAG TPA: hypothetical protein QGH10_23260, partial [Armatimonadota bacterium]|nr:hypothetical protein [Armatimonadota bacterium]
TQSLTRDQIAMIVAEEIRNPTERMRRHFERLPATHQSFLIAMLDVASNTSTVNLLNESYYRHSADQSVPPKTVARDLQGTAIRPLTVHSQVWSPRSRVYEDTHRDTYVWVHPSWRDMVIERLAADDATRAAFVSNCALPGLLLALSTAGGAKGERETPLLRAAEDWDALISRAAALIDNETDDVAHRILSATHGIVARAAPKGALTDGLLRLATAVLSACREAWALSAVCACDRQS